MDCVLILFPLLMLARSSPMMDCVIAYVTLPPPHSHDNPARHGSVGTPATRRTGCCTHSRRFRELLLRSSPTSRQPGPSSSVAAAADGDVDPTQRSDYWAAFAPPSQSSSSNNNSTKKTLPSSSQRLSYLYQTSTMRPDVDPTQRADYWNGASLVAVFTQQQKESASSISNTNDDDIMAISDIVPEPRLDKQQRNSPNAAPQERRKNWAVGSSAQWKDVTEESNIKGGTRYQPPWSALREQVNYNYRRTSYLWKVQTKTLEKSARSWLKIALPDTTTKTTKQQQRSPLSPPLPISSDWQKQRDFERHLNNNISMPLPTPVFSDPVKAAAAAAAATTQETKPTNAMKSITTVPNNRPSSFGWLDFFVSVRSQDDDSDTVNNINNANDTANWKRLSFGWLDFFVTVHKAEEPDDNSDAARMVSEEKLRPKAR